MSSALCIFSGAVPPVFVLLFFLVCCLPTTFPSGCSLAVQQSMTLPNSEQATKPDPKEPPFFRGQFFSKQPWPLVALGYRIFALVQVDGGHPQTFQTRLPERKRPGTILAHTGGKFCEAGVPLWMKTTLILLFFQGGGG